MLAFLTPPRYPGCRLTAKKIFNLYRSRYEATRLSTSLASYPIKLTIEPANLCNLRCPACFTGDGQVGRGRGAMSLDLYRRLLEELGDYLFQLEFANWGEPLLNKDICTMFREAHERGISTLTSTNFSLPFDAAAAEEIVSSGLDVLGVSIDGARQETYQQYRVRGDLKRVLANCRLVAEAKRRLGSSTPRLVWEFHVFPHNVADTEAATAMAGELGMDIEIEKGWVVGPDWDAGGKWQFHAAPLRPFPCLFLWHYAVVNNDGGVAPCCGSFYREDDMGRISAAPGDGGARDFRSVWNGERFREARRFYRSRTGSEQSRSRICFDCPNTIVWNEWQAHRKAGGPPQAYRPRLNPNDSFNYFWNRRPRPPAGHA